MRYVQKEKFYKSGNEPGSGSRNYGNTCNSSRFRICMAETDERRRNKRLQLHYATEFDVQQETADNAEFASDTEDSISDKAGSNEADSDEEVFAEAVIPDENGAVDNRQLLEKYLNDILYGQDPDTQPAASLGEDVLNGQPYMRNLRVKSAQWHRKVVLPGLKSVQIWD